MNTNELLKAIILKIRRAKKLIIIIGIAGAALAFVKAKMTKAQYTSRASIFPLSNPSDNGLGGNTLSGLLGLGESSKNFSSDASINIIELATSRNLRETIALTQLPAQFGNKTIAAALIEEANHNALPLIDEKIQMPSDSFSLGMIGGKLLAPNIVAKLNKNGILEINFTCTKQELVKPITEAIIANISQFYINLRIEKATFDYRFTLSKIDSLQEALDSIDRRTVGIHNTTLFTPADKMEYALPKENIALEKARTLREQDMSVNNREEALWRLQKSTPIVAVLDKPNPPFEITKPSSIIYAIAGFVIITLIFISILVAPLLWQYIKAEIVRAMSNSAEA